MRAREIRYYLTQLRLALRFRSSGDYWEQRYRSGLDSGRGSYGELSRYKADFLNGFVSRNQVESVIEIGCGDGNQLSLAAYPRYLGLDVSRTAVQMCAKRFADDPTKSFLWYDPDRAINLANFLTADLTLSLDVIYHLTETPTYDKYLGDLFSMSRRYVIVYSSDSDEPSSVPHVRHRHVTRDVEQRFPGVRLLQSVENPFEEHTFARFFVFERSG